MKRLPGLSDLTTGSIFCIGRNYAKHAQELGNTAPDQPVVFLKPSSSIIGDGGVIQLPEQSKQVHHEVELVIAIGKEGKNIPRAQALKHVAGYTVGIDVTARDIQQQAKSKGHPWSVAKGFDTFAPLGHFESASPTTDFGSMALALEVNGEIRQQGSTADMIFPLYQLIAYLSSVFTLQPGDLIFTGTPAGVSSIESGDKIRASLNQDEIVLEVTVHRDE